MRHIILWPLAAVLGLMLVVWLLLSYGLQPAPFPSGSTSAERLAPGKLKVVNSGIDLIDHERPTPRNRDYPGDPTRRLKGAVWYPESGGPYPLIIHSHGFTSSYRNGAYLAHHLASHGYVVAAVDHPLTHMFAPGDPNVRDVVNQPGDVSFLIDILTSMPEAIDPALAGRVDAERIGVMGVSLGGLTATLTSYHPRLLDERVKAALSIAGPTAFLAPEFFERRSVPFLMLAGDADALVPWDANASPVPRNVLDGHLLTLSDGSHTGFSGGTALLRWMRNPDAVGCWSLKRNLDIEPEKDLAALLGGKDIGVNEEVDLDYCTAETLPETMNVLRQQMITRVAVRAFFDSVLHSDPSRRQEAADYLGEILQRELPDVTYR